MLHHGKRIINAHAVFVIGSSLGGSFECVLLGLTNTTVLLHCVNNEPDLENITVMSSAYAIGTRQMPKGSSRNNLIQMNCHC